MTAKETPPPNPYLDPTRPLFYGREPAFRWLSERIEQGGESDRPWILFGRSGIGKSLLVDQIRRGRLGGSVTTVVVDWEKPTTQSLLPSPSRLWSGLSRLIMNQLVLQEVPFETEALQARVDSEADFKERFLPAVFEGLNGRHLVMVFDHVDAVVERPQFQSLMGAWRALLAEHAQLHSLLVLQQHPDRYTLIDYSGEAISLGAINPNAATQLLRDPVPYYVSDSVVEYALKATEQRPAELQRIGHYLYERWAAGDLLQPTLADLAQGIRRLDLNRSEASGAFQEASMSVQLDRGGSPLRSSRNRGFTYSLIALVAVLLIVTTALAINSNRQVQNRVAAEQTAVAVERTATRIAVLELTVSPTPTATDTATPTLTPSPTTTPIPPTPTATIDPDLLAALTATPTPIPTATPVNIVRSQDNMPMIFIDATAYVRGSDPALDSTEPDELPLNEIMLDAFYIDQFEVSVAQYTLFLNDLGSHRTACAGFECVRVSPDVIGTYIEEDREESPVYTVLAGFEAYPVNHVSWYGAVEYCNWIGGRLPTEAEWEYAAKGKDSRLYPWGNDQPDFTRAFYNVEFNQVLAVDSLPNGVSPFGLYNMAGSMWEWVGDWYDAEYYSWGTLDNPSGPSGGLERVARGGGWASDTDESRLRVANRNFYLPDALRADVGFRCARSVSIEN